MPKPRVDLDPNQQTAEEALKDLAEDAGFTKPEDQKKYIEDKKGLPFVIESVAFPGNIFVSTLHVARCTLHVAGKVIIRLNTRHPFYREMWEPLKAISERDPGTVSGDEAVKAARRTIEALTLLLVAYGKAESMHPNPVEHVWGFDAILGPIPVDPSQQGEERPVSPSEVGRGRARLFWALGFLRQSKQAASP